MEPLEFTINLNPVTKKNHSQIIVNKQTGRPFIVPSKQYKQYERDAGYFLKGKGLNISEPVNVQAVYFMGSRRRVDIANLHACLHDILVKYGIWADDSMLVISGTNGSAVRYCKENPRTEVLITPASEEDVLEVEKFKTK